MNAMAENFYVWLRKKMGKGKAGCMCIGKGKELYISLHRVRASAFSLSCFWNSFG